MSRILDEVLGLVGKLTGRQAELVYNLACSLSMEHTFPGCFDSGKKVSTRTRYRGEDVHCAVFELLLDGNPSGGVPLVDIRWILFDREVKIIERTNPQGAGRLRAYRKELEDGLDAHWLEEEGEYHEINEED